jgi:hypothetical protein
MAANVVIKVLQALQKQGIFADTAYPGKKMLAVTEVMTAVSLERLDYTGRTATVLVTVMVPVAMGGGACEDAAIGVGAILEELGAVCMQEECRFNGYADAFYVRVLGTFRGSAVMDNWDAVSDFQVRVNGIELRNVVSFKAEQAVDQVTGTPLSTAVWTFRIVEEIGRGELPTPLPMDSFKVDVVRTNSKETYSDCAWIACQVENTATGMRQIRTGISKTRDEIAIV